jgi:hypothetical protein
MTSAAEHRLSRHASPVRLTLANRLGEHIDGAWWPHSGRMAAELPELVVLLGSRLGAVMDIALNWPATDGTPSWETLGWETKHQRVITVTGDSARANLLVIPERTGHALAVMVLRQAANLPVDPVHCETAVFRAAERVVRTACFQCKGRKPGQY